jgi:hypothetical protein
MSHNAMTAEQAIRYALTSEQAKRFIDRLHSEMDNYKRSYDKGEKMGEFVFSSYAGSYMKTCFILLEFDRHFFIEYYDENIGACCSRMVKREDVNLDIEVSEPVFYVIKNLDTGSYHTNRRLRSSCPALYSSKAKAEMRIRQNRLRGNWVVMKWEISETPA